MRSGFKAPLILEEGGERTASRSGSVLAEESQSRWQNLAPAGNRTPVVKTSGDQNMAHRDPDNGT